MDEMYLIGQEGLYLWIGFTDKIFSAADSTINTTDYIFQKSHRALFSGNDSLPVPLVNIQRMDVVEFLVSTDSIHIGVYAITGSNMILRQCEPLPFGQ